MVSATLFDSKRTSYFPSIQEMYILYALHYLLLSVISPDYDLTFHTLSCSKVSIIHTIQVVCQVKEKLECLLLYIKLESNFKKNFKSNRGKLHFAKVCSVLSPTGCVLTSFKFLLHSFLFRGEAVLYHFEVDRRCRTLARARSCLT